MIRFIRHAQCTNNVDGNNDRDSPLTELGISQANQLSGEFDLVICSTLRRTRQTLDNSSIKYSQIMFTDLCREIMDGGGHNYYNNEVIKAETEEEYKERLSKFKKLLSEKLQTNQRIVVISHGCFSGFIDWWSLSQCLAVG